MYLKACRAQLKRTHHPNQVGSTQQQTSSKHVLDMTISQRGTGTMAVKDLDWAIVVLARKTKRFRLEEDEKGTVSSQASIYPTIKCWSTLQSSTDLPYS